MTGVLCISSHALLYWFQSEYLLKVKESGLSDSLLCSTGSHLMHVSLSLSLVQMCALCFSPSRSGGCSAVSGPLGWACAGIHAVQKTDANICQGIEWEIDSNWGKAGAYEAGSRLGLMEKTPVVWGIGGQEVLGYVLLTGLIFVCLRCVPVEMTARATSSHEDMQWGVAGGGLGVQSSHLWGRLCSDSEDAPRVFWFF